MDALPVLDSGTRDATVIGWAGDEGEARATAVDYWRGLLDGDEPLGEILVRYAPRAELDNNPEHHAPDVVEAVASRGAFIAERFTGEQRE